MNYSPFIENDTFRIADSPSFKLGNLYMDYIETSVNQGSFETVFMKEYVLLTKDYNLKKYDFEKDLLLE